MGFINLMSINEQLNSSATLRHISKTDPKERITIFSPESYFI